jgi:hypothetical protein
MSEEKRELGVIEDVLGLLKAPGASLEKVTQFLESKKTNTNKSLKNTEYL